MEMYVITIDGSQGEGGGQILRTSLALSLVTGQPFKIMNIRAGRKKPGLMLQHLTAVRAAVTVGNAEAKGASIGSQELTFIPGAVKGGKYDFSIGTAGSVTLILQTILLALILTDHPSDLTLEGGTHNPFAPPWDFLAKTFLPVVNKMGVNVETSLERYGFYPAGGGKFTCKINPAKKLTGYDLNIRGDIICRKVRTITANLPEKIGWRECKTVSESLGWPREYSNVEVTKESSGPGNVVIIEIGSTYVTEVVTGFGERGVPAEVVASSAAREAKEYLESGVPVGVHHADQLMLPFALAGSGSYTTMPLSQHSRTNLDVIRYFLYREIKIEQVDGNCRLNFS